MKSQVRKNRVRRKLKRVSSLPRLCVFKSNKNIYTQIIDDATQQTLAAASTVSKELKGKFKSVNKTSAAAVGELIAKVATAKKIEKVCFDRGGYLYHGTVKALADAARENGLQF